MISKKYKYIKSNNFTKIFIDDSFEHFAEFLSSILKINKSVNFNNILIIIDEKLRDIVFEINIFKSIILENKIEDQINYNKFKTKSKLSNKEYKDINYTHNFRINCVFLEISEKNKDFNNLDNIFSIFFNNKIDKKSFILAMGGGALTDIVGFASSIYKRGILFGFIPTTFLSMIDASFGGKNAINYNNIKNLLGTINQPYQIYISTFFIKSLPDTEFLSGFAEFLKYLLIDEVFYNKFIKDFSIFYLESQNKRSNATIYDILKEFFIENKKYLIYALDTKYSFIKNDIYDSGKRHVLNFGHTVSHSLEIIFELKHGIALYPAILLELKIISRLYKSSEFILKKAEKIYEKFNLPKNIKDAFEIEKKIDFEKWLDSKNITKKEIIDKIINLMHEDKKNNEDNYKILVFENRKKLNIENIPYKIFDSIIEKLLQEFL